MRPASGPAVLACTCAWSLFVAAGAEEQEPGAISMLQARCNRVARADPARILKAYYINVDGQDGRRDFMERQLRAAGIPFERVPAIPMTTWQEMFPKYGDKFMRRGIDVSFARFEDCRDAGGRWNASNCRPADVEPVQQPWLHGFLQCPLPPEGNVLTCPIMENSVYYDLKGLGKDFLSKQEGTVWNWPDPLLASIMSLELTHEHILADLIPADFKGRDDLGSDPLVLILEDDAVIPADISLRLGRLLPKVPDDWSSLRLGYWGHGRSSDRVADCVLEPKQPLLGHSMAEWGVPRYYYSGTHATITSATGPRLESYVKHLQSLPFWHFMEALVASGRDGYKQYVLESPLSVQSDDPAVLSESLHEPTTSRVPVELEMSSAWRRFCTGEDVARPDGDPPSY